ncbi:hypothetical protein FWP33_18740 [Vibrio parahaemolyticus]|nr:hypothetical protein [Vibrio parahaemolyticus]EJC7176213.1 hypothetical protein [Vibrio parahaemolyticus]EJG0009947.1 hypothetical protein [Vibrio parahaemolyticus]
MRMNIQRATRIYKWIVHSPLTLVAYTYESLGFFDLAAAIYRIPVSFCYAPAQFNFGLIHVSGEYVTDKGHTIGVKLIRSASEQGYKPAIEWLSKFEQLANANEEQAEAGRKLKNELLEMMGANSALMGTRNPVIKYGKFVFFHTLFFAIIYDLLSAVFN